MSKYGYINCNCSDPAHDYIESHEIIDVDETGFTVWYRHTCEYLGREGSPNLESADNAFDNFVERTREWYDKWGEGKPYPEWFNHEYKIVPFTEKGYVYANVYTKERVNVPYEFIKEHSNDNHSYGYYVKRWSKVSDYDKELFRVFGEWLNNVRISDDGSSYTTHTWSLD